jgi:hypothetical protein
MILENITGGKITLLHPRVIMTYAAMSTPPRVDNPYIRWDNYKDTIPIVFWNQGARVIGMPGPQPGVTYIVTQQIFDLCQDRTDLVVPMNPAYKLDGGLEGYRALKAR